jgi:hypothetical protein
MGSGYGRNISVRTQNFGQTAVYINKPDRDDFYKGLLSFMGELREFGTPYFWEAILHR